MKLELALSRLTAPIPPPTRGKPRERAQWAGLKVGQQLTNIDPLLGLASGTLWIVVRTTDFGAELTAPGVVYTITRKDWQTLFKRARKVRKPTSRASRKKEPTK